jgi:hypothetical protein
MRLALRITVILALFFILSGCLLAKNFSENNIQPVSEYGFQPIEPVNYVDVFDLPAIKAASQQTTDKNNSILKYLPNESVQIHIAHITGDGDFSYVPVRLSVKGEKYQVKVDFLQYRNDAIESRKLLYQSGVGFRLIADFQSIKGNINLGNFLGLGIEANAGNIAGTIRFETLGICGSEISSLLPLPTEISTQSIQNAIHAGVSIKAKFYNDGVNIWPQVVAVKKLLPDQPLTQIVMPIKNKDTDQPEK